MPIGEVKRDEAKGHGWLTAIFKGNVCAGANSTDCGYFDRDRQYLYELKIA